MSETKESRFLCYCRSGYESELATECETHLANNGSYGYSKFEKGGSLVQVFTPAVRAFPLFEQLVFARQKLKYLSQLKLIDKADRITPIIDAILNTRMPIFGNVLVEYADNEDGKALAKLCKKFTVPLRAALRKQNLLTNKQDNDRDWLHILFEDFETASLCVSRANDRSMDLLGVKRLKFPPDAPSRSTLKLEEAIKTFLSDEQQRKLLKRNMTAVDLGACPGGWTYQLVIRGIKVEAVDNGAIDNKLMETGLVKHFLKDGFGYRPAAGRVDWIVCDMIENPYRVSELMTQWLNNKWAKATIFNLKLPMKRRYETVREILSALQGKLNVDSKLTIKAKHLYHDRDEVTVLVLPEGNFH